MIYKMIQNKRDKWFLTDECTVKEIVDYIESKGELRDAQIEAIKTYLFLKIACSNKPLYQLFEEGFFNGINIEEIELSGKSRDFLLNNPGAAALLEYAMQKDDKGNIVSEKLAHAIKRTPEEINYKRVIEDLFYGVRYTDYLFSLPMGAGKTYLMAAFIYLDMYFANNEPSNPAFAHNFIIFAPSGLKSSVVPSLRTIQNFDPTWVLPEPSASEIKRMLKFEVLDQTKTANKSNKIKNPNVQKISNYQPLNELFGLVAVTNAEKVILDGVNLAADQLSIFEDTDDEKDRKANELRNLIGKLPALSVFIDEVHHAVKDEIKLRGVVNRWTENRSVNSVVGFSGTPYLEKADKIKINDKISIASEEISNIVYYYPLIGGVGNFLKHPVVKIADISDSSLIVEEGVRLFLKQYRDTVYEGGLSAKLGIYCGSIEKCEEIIYPLVLRVATEYGLNEENILRFHKGNKQYPQPTDSQLQFESLDKSISKIRIILLVQIGKEGWDCRSLSGIILSQEGDCPTNMVLQTSCRCLRQVVKGDTSESALIYLNNYNAATLEEQLKKQHHISVKEFESGEKKSVVLNRYDRTDYLKLPSIDYYQLRIAYEDLIIEKADPSTDIPRATMNSLKKAGTIRTTDFRMLREEETIDFYNEKHDIVPITFHKWILRLVKESFGTIRYDHLKHYESELRSVFDTITLQEGEYRFFSPKYDVDIINANIRKAFADIRDFSTAEELIPETSSLLNINNFTSEVRTSFEESYYPSQTMVENIIKDDKGKLKVDKAISDTIDKLVENGNYDLAEQLRAQAFSHPKKNRSFHYLPYRTDSGFEQEFLKEILSFSELDKLNLEVYYNGDRAMTEFKVKCYRQRHDKWDYIG